MTLRGHGIPRSVLVRPRTGDHPARRLRRVTSRPYGDAVTETEPDRDALLRRVRWEDWLAVPALVGFFAGLVLLAGRFWSSQGATSWLVAGAVLLVGAVVALARGRSSRQAARRIQVALRTRTDPGPDLRMRTDALAAHLDRTRLAGWLVLLLPLGLVVNGPWAEAPGRAALGALLVLVPAIAYAASWNERVEEAQRWVADPPGPPRPAPSRTAVQRWSRPRRLVPLVLGLVLAGFVVGLVLALVQ